MPEEEELRYEIARLSEEVEELKTDIGQDITKLSGLIGRLAAEVKERVKPEEVDEVRRMVSELRTFHEGLLLPWRRQISEELEARALWAERLARGEAELVNRVEGEYAVYESYHHIPSCETWVRTVPKPYS